MYPPSGKLVFRVAGSHRKICHKHACGLHLPIFARALAASEMGMRSAASTIPERECTGEAEHHPLPRTSVQRKFLTANYLTICLVAFLWRGNCIKRIFTTTYVARHWGWAKRENRVISRQACGELLRGSPLPAEDNPLCFLF